MVAGSFKGSVVAKMNLTNSGAGERVFKIDLNANDPEAGCKILAGTCRAMGVTVDWDN